MINETTKNLNNGKGKPIKTFPEQYEINLRKLISEYLIFGDMLVGEIDLDGLILSIMEFHERRKG